MKQSCLNRSQHHCQHAHNCTNKYHRHSLQISKGIHSQTNFNKFSTIKEADQQDFNQGENPKCKKLNDKKSNEEFYLKMNESLRQKKEIIKQLQKQLKNLRNKKIKIINPLQSNKHSCQDNNGMNFELMYMYAVDERNRLKMQNEQLKKINEIIKLQLQIEKQKVSQYQKQRVRNEMFQDKINYYKLQISKLDKSKKQIQVQRDALKKIQAEFKQTKIKLAQYANSKQNQKQLNKHLTQNMHSVEQELKNIQKDKQIYKQKYQEQVKTNLNLQAKIKQLLQNNKTNHQQILKQTNNKIKNFEIKFDFSCKEINTLRNNQAKLRQKITQLQTQILQSKQSRKNNSNVQSKVQKQLRHLSDITFKENQKLRQKSSNQQQQILALKIKLVDVQNSLIRQKQESTKILDIKKLQIQQLEKKIQSLEMQNYKLRKGQISNYPINNQKEKNLQVQEKKNDSNNQNNQIQNIESKYKQQLNSARNINIQLQVQLDSLKSRIKIFQKQQSVNNWSQFQPIMKQNNNRIKNLLQQRSKLNQQISSLKMQVQNMRIQLSQKSQPPPDYLSQNNEQQIRRLKNEIDEKQFEMINLRREIESVNNRYSGYYQLQRQNKELKYQIQNLSDILQKKKRDWIQNISEKEELLRNNKYLIDQLEWNIGRSGATVPIQGQYY